MKPARQSPQSGIFTPTVRPKAPVKFIEEIWPEVFAREISLCELSYHAGGVRFDEIVFLASIVAHLKPQKLFEIGTCQGRTTINLARNTGKIECFYTLNLPPDDSCQVKWLAQDRLLYESSKTKIGKRWKKYEEADIITQLYGDSSQFDFSLYKDMDFVFIDANKQKEYVAHDSRNGWHMLRKGGIIIWHDYGYCDGVTEAVDEFSANECINITNIYKSTLAIAVK